MQEHSVVTAYCLMSCFIGHVMEETPFFVFHPIFLPMHQDSRQGKLPENFAVTALGVRLQASVDVLGCSLVDELDLRVGQVVDLQLENIGIIHDESNELVSHWACRKVF